MFSIKYTAPVLPCPPSLGLGEATGADLRPQASLVLPGHRLGLAERRSSAPRPRGARAPGAATAFLDGAPGGLPGFQLAMGVPP